MRTVEIKIKALSLGVHKTTNFTPPIETVSGQDFAQAFLLGLGAWSSL